MSIFLFVDNSTQNIKVQLDKIQSYYHWKGKLFLLLGLFILTTSSNEIQACPPSKEKIEIPISADQSHNYYDVGNFIPPASQESRFSDEVLTNTWSSIHSERSELLVKLFMISFEENKADRMRPFFKHYFFESSPEAIHPSILR